MLTLLVEDFEDRNYSLPTAPPDEIVRHLVDLNGLKYRRDKRFSNASTVSEVLSGKRDLAKATSKDSVVA